MRGKVIFICAGYKSTGITPARAGKSNDIALILSVIGDHPRACGEKKSFSPYLKGAVGSPPRVRGKVQSAVGAVPQAGITPARAGKSGTAARAQAQSGDHPRACGEKDGGVPTAEQKKGSPPRVRGKGL